MPGLSLLCPGRGGERKIPIFFFVPLFLIQQVTLHNKSNKLKKYLRIFTLFIIQPLSDVVLTHGCK